MQLVINSPGTFITCKDDCFSLKQEDRKFTISPLKVESIVVSNKAMITTQAINMALEHNINVIFLDKYGDPIGRVWFSKMGSTALIRRKQLEAEMSLVGFELVIDMIGTKLDNQIRFMKKLMHARPGKETLFENNVKQISDARERLKEQPTKLDDARNSIMGLEGTAGKAYFQCLSKVMPEKYSFKGRSRRPAKDPFNAVLNYCYGMLYGLVEKACILSGLDPFVGFMHTDNYNKKSLVFDLIEPFRIFAEQTAVYLFTGKKIKDDYFDEGDNAVSLNQKGKPIIVEAMNKHLDETIRYNRKNVKRRYIIQHETHKMANILLANKDDKRPEWLDIKEF